MSRLWKCWFPSIVLILGYLPCWLCAQTGSDSDIHEVKTWYVFGRVSTIDGEPLDGVAVRLNIGSTAEDQRIMETDLQGKFHAEVRLNAAASNRLQGNLIASKEGYLDGRETLDLGHDEYNSGIHIVLHKPDEDPDGLSLKELIGAIALPLRDMAAVEFSEESSREEFLRGCEELIDQRDAIAAVSLLKNSVERLPDCAECRLFLSLALLNAGSWSSAREQLQLASNANETRSMKRPEPVLVMGVLEGWQGRHNEAAELYQYALGFDPKNPLILQELGRTLLALKNWELADQYLSKAIQSGASDGVRLLRVRALLERSELEEAEREIDRYAAGRKIKDLPQEARRLHFTVQSRLTLLLYGQVKAMTDQSPAELIKAVPALQGLKVAADQSMLEEVLKKTGEGVDTFFKDMPNTASMEQVHQERLDRNGKVRTSLDQEFQYFMEANAGQPGMGVKEYRSTTEGKSSSMGGTKEGLMLTKGFASTSSVIHPVNRDGADFRYLGMQTIEGRDAHVIAFAQNPQTAKMVTRFVTDEGSALILTHGLVWIDAESFQILRIYTSLLDPVPNLRLRKLTTEIQFHQVAFDGNSITFWLPQAVEIIVDWRGRILRNQHSYSDFKLFNVESKEEREPVKIPDSTPLEG